MEIFKLQRFGLEKVSKKDSLRKTDGDMFQLIKDSDCRLLDYRQATADTNRHSLEKVGTLQTLN